MNDSQKYVASTTLDAPLAWENSTLLEGDATEAVAKLKFESSQDLVVLGSGDLVQSLMRHNLIDEYVLLIHPLILGSGRRLFIDGGQLATFRLVDTKISTTGVVIATYQPAAACDGRARLRRSPDARRSAADQSTGGDGGLQHLHPRLS